MRALARRWQCLISPVFACGCTSPTPSTPAAADVPAEISVADSVAATEADTAAAPTEIALPADATPGTARTDADASQELPDAIAPASPTLVNVTWAAMPAPSTIPERANAYSTASVQLTWSDGTLSTQALAWHLLTKTGEKLGGKVIGAVLDNKGQPLAPPLFSDCPDGTTVLPVPGGGLAMLTHFEYVSAAQCQVPATMGLSR
jgi:hypothetical protein